MADEKSYPQFSFTFDPTMEADPSLFGAPGQDRFDDDIPLADQQAIPLFPDATARNQYETLDPEKMPHVPDELLLDSQVSAEKPAEERTADLFAYMNPHRQMLTGILAAAERPCSTTAMGEVVEQLRRRKFSVYTTSNLCTMLETAGALERVTEDGTPYAQFQPAPDIVVVDGEEYWQPSEPPAVHWLTTPVGQAVVDANDPLGRMQVMFDREPELLPIYRQVLELADGEGVTMSQLSGAVDANPAIAEPRRFFVQHFVEAIERCEGIVWDAGRWKTTETGRQMIAGPLADVEAAPAYEPYAEALPKDGIMPTETQGVNW